jgi:hypothetical protein
VTGDSHYKHYPNFLAGQITGQVAARNFCAALPPGAVRQALSAASFGRRCADLGKESISPPARASSLGRADRRQYFLR